MNRRSKIEVIGTYILIGVNSRYHTKESNINIPKHKQDNLK